MKKKIFLLSIMLIVALTAASDEYIDPLTNVVYTYEPGQPTASVKAGYEEVVAPEYGSELEVCYYSGSPDATGDVVILDKFTIGTTEYVVTSIGDRAFWNNEKIKSVSIPETVTDIGPDAFYNCTALTTVQLPRGLMRIADGLFRNCSHLVSVNIPSSVSTIGAYAFARCSSLASITIPDGLTYAGKYAFYGTPWYASQYDNAPDGLFYINSLLFGYKGEKPTGELNIKDGTTCICREAFHDCKELTSVIIPPSVAYVDEYAFEDCTGLKAVYITDIAAWCGIEFQYGYFNRNSSNPLWYAHHLYLNGEEVTELIVPKGVTRIGKYAFDNCSALTSVTLSDGVTSIGENAFRNCGNLTNVSIPSSVAKIESQAFIWCDKINAVYISDIAAWCGISFDNTSNPLYYGARLYLDGEEVTDLTIPEGVSSIGDGAFRNYSYLTSVTILEGVTSIGKYAFNTCRKITNLSLPTSLDKICYSAFANCSSLTSIIIPKGVTNIDESAFEGCSNLTNVYCYAHDVPETSRYAYEDCPIASATLHVPAVSVDKYKATEPWKNFGNIVAIEEMAQEYFPEGTKWTEIRLDTLKYDSWYSKVGDEWVPNFETVEYYVKGEYNEEYRSYKLAYTNGPEWTDSLTLLISESQYGIEASVAIFDENKVSFPPGWAYGFGDWKEGNTLSYQTINGANTPSIPPVGIKEYGTITEIKEANFGGVRPLKYVDLDGTRLIHGVGVTTWNDGECLFGPVKPYEALSAWGAIEPEERHYRSMLVHLERNGEVLYDVWPLKGSTVEVTIDNLNYFLDLKTHEAIITIRHTCSGEVNIPSEVNYNGETFIVKSMNCHAFYENKEITKVKIPKTLAEIIHYYPYDPDLQAPTGLVDPIYMNPFKGCTALESIEVDEENPNFKSINGVLYSQDDGGQFRNTIYSGTGLFCYPLGIQQESYTIPDGVKFIFGNAFYQNKDLTTLTLPRSTNAIYDEAFYGCTNLKDVYCYAENAPVGYYVFENTPIASATLHVPASSVDEYKKSSTWKGFGNIVALPDPVTFTQGQMATIILPTTPDASKGKYYRLDRCEDGKIIFEQEPTPKAHTPYIIVPNQDFNIDLSTLDLEGCRRDSTKIVGVSFIGTYSRDVFGYKGSFYYYILDSTPDCRNEEGESVYVGPLHAFLEIDWRKNNHQNYEKMEVVLHDKPEDYRPFIEEGKVWKVGGAESGNPVERVEYYYFDGDTIINGKTCKQMMRQRFVSPNHPDYAIYSRWPSLSYVGAWYEEDKKVYFCWEESKEFQKMYDFSLKANDTFKVDGGHSSYVIGPRETGGLKGFKGVYRDIMWAGELNRYNTTWLEGIGNIDGPTYSVYLGKEYHALFLMSCSVGDEIIYLNDEYEDGATPVVLEAPKVRFDFTHTVKTQPKSPKKKVAEKSLYGEYNTQQLDINLDPLNETYQVRITDETGKVVYEKSINAGNIVGLNIDISAFTEGCYTVSVENSHESFTGEFNSNTTGIEEIRSRNSELSGHYIYDLQGRKINAQSSILNAQLPKGIYIQNGKKVVVR